MTKAYMIQWLISALMRTITPEKLKVWMDMGLDMLEDYAKNSATEWDDKVVLPMAKIIREAFNIPDND